MKNATLLSYGMLAVPEWPVVSVGPGEVRAEVASHHVRGKELDREVIQDVKGEDEEVLQQHTVEGGLPEEREPLHTAVHALV